MNGFFNVNKPAGMSSAAVVGVMKRLTGEKRIGHAGTLDPEAAGVLPIMAGRATRLFDYLDPMGTGSNAPMALFTRLGSVGLKDGDELGWLSKSRANIEAYRADPLCGFRSGNALNRELVTLAVKASDPELPFKLPYGFPVMLISGAKDPVGMNGRGVLAAADALEAAGLAPEVILYPGDRHEILNEEDRDKVFADVLRFLRKTLDES